jgi:hypothetical protein
MTGVVLYECLTQSSSGHHVEKAEIWVKEAAEIFDEVFLVTFASPGFTVPGNVRVLSCGPLPSWCVSPETTRLRGLRQAWLNFRGWRAALEEANRRQVPALSLTTLVPGNLLASFLARRNSTTGHIVMAVPGNPESGRPSSVCLRFMIRAIARRGFSFFCNTEVIATRLKTLVAPDHRTIHVTRDPVELPPAPPLQALASQRRMRILIPGDDRAERNGIAMISRCPALLAEAQLIIHVPGASPARVAEIESILRTSSASAEFSIESSYLSRDQLYGLYLSTDAVLLAYSAGLQMGSGNLLIALACKRPVLASGFPAFTEMEGEVGRLGESFDGSQPGTLIPAVQRLRSWDASDWKEFDRNCGAARSLFCSRAVATTTFKHLLADSRADTLQTP